jgi:hypothetical protein
LAVRIVWKIGIVVILLVSMPFVVPILLWGASFIDIVGTERCSFGSVSDVEYQKILSRVSAERWTVWPGLSKGVFLPSDNSDVGDQLLSHIKELAGSNPTTNRQLASAHAVMRSIGADYVQTLEVPGMRGAESRVHFTYYLPQLRFAPMCILCLVWWDTTIDVIFSHDVTTGRYELQAPNVRNAQLKYSPDKHGARNIPQGSCPEFRTALSAMDDLK